MPLISKIMTSQQAYSISPPRSHLYDSVKAFAKFNDKLHTLCEEVSGRNYTGISRAKVNGAEIMRELRSIFSITELREAGSFFTGDALANEAVSKFVHPITSSSIILDPTCGAGNLLMSIPRRPRRFVLE